MGQDVDIANVSMRYGREKRNAVTDVNVRIEPGEFFSFLGPSGCGKTTLLRLVSGFIDPTQGEVRINGRDMRGIGPNRRPTAMIFQNLALFPLMTVADNIGFGLEVRHVSRDERMKKVGDLLELVDLPRAANKKVSDLSGGQMQRVAIARALAVEPAVLLLDEPLSALDLKLRQYMRAELRKIQRRTQVTFIYITHDQGEALNMSDRVGVMSEKGIVQQVAAPDVLYNHPETAFVASFVGESNAFDGKVTGPDREHAGIETAAGLLRGRNVKALGPGQAAIAFVRPEAVFTDKPVGAADNALTGTVVTTSFEGAFININLRVGDQIMVIHHTNDGHTAPPSTGSEIQVTFSADSTLLLPNGEPSGA